MLRTLVCRAGSGLLKHSWQPVPVLWGSRAPQRWASSLPVNTVVLFVPQQEAWVVERMGRFHRILEPGLNFLIPILDRVKYVQSLKEIVIDVPEQSAVSLDNVTLQIDGVLYLRILDPFKASYGVEDPEYAVTQLAQTTMRSELGKLTLDKVFRERESLNSNIVHSINQASDEWGIRCLRYEIKDIHVPPRVKESMQMQVEAERKKRATVLESEGAREAAINVAEGCKQAQILASEGEKAEQINRAAEWKCCSIFNCGRTVRLCFLQPGQGVQHHLTALQHRRHQQHGHSGHDDLWEFIEDTEHSRQHNP
ncbi:stomatin-like protein 2, mitochondrial isoform X2 [Cyprinus carpio]|uniref:Stomatin-like protein 2, mitochondrial n=1 Tax=Cyprinus carpio TaxID=7962 RepID=A0A9R0B410_CYPCA|nr:stomatin-like protein 2, mitochondrial isoform X2 [Cyprinus carpio]